jgi:hypothetical protein
LTACASVDRDLGATRASWQGASYDDVVARWGPPTQREKDSHTWVSEGAPWRGGGPSVGVGVFGGGMSGVGVGVGFPVGQTGATSRCERTFVFQNGLVAEQTWHGPTDYCATFKR